MIIQTEENKENEKNTLIIDHNPADVICRKGGKGGISVNNIGSRIYRSLVLIYKVLSILHLQLTQK